VALAAQEYGAKPTYGGSRRTLGCALLARVNCHSTGEVSKVWAERIGSGFRWSSHIVTLGFRPVPAAAVNYGRRNPTSASLLLREPLLPIARIFPHTLAQNFIVQRSRSIRIQPASISRLRNESHAVELKLNDASVAFL
jgi:hypothetical protein